MVSLRIPCAIAGAGKLKTEPAANPAPVRTSLRLIDASIALCGFHEF
jgi:hypothetical protein